MKNLKKGFVDISGNIKHDLTGIIDESVMGGYNYRSYQIIEETNRSSRRMETLIQG